MATAPLWSPDPQAIRSTAMHRLIERLRSLPDGPRSADYATVHRWSVTHCRELWTLLLDQLGILCEGPRAPAIDPSTMPGARFFPQLRLSFAENLLRHRDDRTAVVSLSEARAPRRLTYEQLYREVARVRAGLVALGVQPGDRIAAFVPNSHEPIIAMLAATSLGAIWSSCSPDFGVQGIVDRFGQIEPRVLVAINGYAYHGKRFDCLDKVTQIVRAIPSIEHVVLVPHLPDHPERPTELRCPVSLWDGFGDASATRIDFPRFPFNQPLYVLYSSGTTGVPKCIVHGAGGTLLQHAKELVLHSDVRRDSNLTYFTTCGWMMWNWLVSALFTGCTVTVYDGSPSHPDLDVLWQLAEREGITHFGTSAKFIGSCRDKVTPRQHGLQKLRVILSTGSPLLPEDFDWIYGAVKRDVQLASISGGTDIISCFMLGNPMLPVYRGEIQCLGLGMDVAAYDDNGKPVLGAKGELVCRTPFPSMPVAFWDDPQSTKYRKAYFDRTPGIWFHGDYIAITGTQGEAGGVVVYGRSDATLNPGGVRIGTAELYRLVETLAEIDDSIVIGQPHKGDVRVVLFVKLAPGVTWSSTLEQRIKTAIRDGATPRHVPAVIVPVEKIPYTLSGKKMELAVLEVVQGRDPKNKEAMADATALACYRNLPALAS